MKACNGMWMVQMHLPMNMKSRAFGLAFSSENITVKIADQQAGSGDLIECATERVDEEERRVSRHERGEVVANAFMKAEARSHAKARGEIDTRLLDGRRIQSVRRWA
jgi:hypothetical protein